MCGWLKKKKKQKTALVYKLDSIQSPMVVTLVKNLWFSLLII